MRLPSKFSSTYSVRSSLEWLTCNAGWGTGVCWQQQERRLNFNHRRSFPGSQITRDALRRRPLQSILKPPVLILRTEYLSIIHSAFNSLGHRDLLFTTTSLTSCKPLSPSRLVGAWLTHLSQTGEASRVGTGFCSPILEPLHARVQTLPSPSHSPSLTIVASLAFVRGLRARGFGTLCFQGHQQAKLS